MWSSWCLLESSTRNRNDKLHFNRNNKVKVQSFIRKSMIKDNCLWYHRLMKKTKHIFEGLFVHFKILWYHFVLHVSFYYTERLYFWYLWSNTGQLKKADTAGEKKVGFIPMSFYSWQIGTIQPSVCVSVCVDRLKIHTGSRTEAEWL